MAVMRRLPAFLACLLLALPVRADVAVIINPKNPLAALSRREVQDIFLGRTRAFPDGRSAQPIDQTSPLRGVFYQLLTARPIEQIDAYWARLLFTGQASPPKRVADGDAMLKTVRENEGAIGYIESSQADTSVRLLLVLKP
jgi:ABC-type phosphate transport system substrate-binding protein